MSFSKARREMASRPFAVIFFFLVVFTIMSPPVIARAEIYCLTADICFTIPEGFLLVDKSFSDNIAKIMKSRFPGANIGFYADLYGAFYQNKIKPAQRLYISPKKTSNLFLVFYKMNSFQKSKFPKEIFTSKSWPSKGQDMNRIREAMMRGIRQSKGLSQGGMSMDLLKLSFLKKYMLIKRTVDFTGARINQLRKAGVPVGNPGKVGTDYIALKCGKTDCAILMYFCDPNGITRQYADIFKNMLSNSSD